MSKYTALGAIVFKDHEKIMTIINQADQGADNVQVSLNDPGLKEEKVSVSFVEVNDFFKSSDNNIVTKLWLTECAHLTCANHLEGGGRNARFCSFTFYDY